MQSVNFKMELFVFFKIFILQFSLFNFLYFSLLFLTIVLFSSGRGGGTGSPEIFVTAPNLGGQASKQVPHFMHFS